MLGVVIKQPRDKGKYQVNKILLEILIIGLLILSNGILAMAEMAIVSARKYRLQQRANMGDNPAKLALQLANSPTRFLSTVQVGITLVGILAGAFAGATLAEQLSASLAHIPVVAAYREAIAVGVVVLLITYLSLIFGELLPKRLALSRPEQIASRIAKPMHLLSIVAAPVIRILSFSTDFVYRLFRIPATAEEPISEAEVNLLMRHGTQVGIFEPQEQQIVARVFHLDDLRADAIMTPRHEVIWIDLNDPAERVCNLIQAHQHSQYPVAIEDLDQVQGVVKVKDLLAQLLCGQDMDIQEVVKPVPFVPENMSALQVLEQFKHYRSHIALVIDEFGGVQGLLTVNDLLETMVGDIPLDEQENESAVQREDGSWLVDGNFTTVEFKELFNIDVLPEEELRLFQTLGGFIMTMLQRVPKSGDQLEWSGFRMEVMDMDRRRVDKVLVYPPNVHAISK